MSHYMKGISRIYMRKIYHAHACWAWGNKRDEGRQTSGVPKSRGCEA